MEIKPQQTFQKWIGLVALSNSIKRLIVCIYELLLDSLDANDYEIYS